MSTMTIFAQSWRVSPEHESGMGEGRYVHPYLKLK